MSNVQSRPHPASGKPGFLFLGATGSDKDSIASLAGAIAGTGHPVAVEQGAADLNAVLSSIGTDCDGVFVVAGSTAAMDAFDVAARTPDVVRGIVCLAPSTSTQSGGGFLQAVCGLFQRSGQRDQGASRRLRPVVQPALILTPRGSSWRDIIGLQRHLGGRVELAVAVDEGSGLASGRNPAIAGHIIGFASRVLRDIRRVEGSDRWSSDRSAAVA